VSIAVAKSARAWTCGSNVLSLWTFPRRVDGEPQEPHVVRYGPIPSDNPHGFVRGYTCTCRGFRYRADCRHIKEARGRRCGWNAACEPGVLPIRRACPECGGPVKMIEVTT